MSFATKYRPVQLEDVVGQPFITDTFKQASINNRFSNAYLLSGMHGSGKTTIGRIIAALINCENPKDGKICGKCRACISIMSDSSVDFLELNAATERGIDNIKEILSASKWTPQELKKKVYLIDECHQLSSEAFSALLKDLEEPPEHVVFILCTTNINKMLPTISDRCQRFNFKKIQSIDIFGRIKIIAQKEKIRIEDTALHILAKIARGSLRNAITLLEQVYTLKGNELIDVGFISKYFGFADRSILFEIVSAIIKQDVAVVLDRINDLVISSVDPKEILYEISELLRAIMIIKAKKNSFGNIVDLPDFEIKLLKEAGENLKCSQLLKMCDIFSEIEKKLEYHLNIRWVMEAALINCILTLREP